jgi:C4-dicarboxylate transporter, DctQ subunit
VNASLLIAVAGFVLLAAAATIRAGLERHERARSLFRLGGRLEVGAVALLLGTLVVLGSVQILLRNAFHSGLLWADPLMRHIVLWLGAMGAALASAHMRHITVDALSRLLPASWKPARRLVVYGITAVIAYVLAVAGVRLVIDERSFGDVAFFGIQTWVMQLILPGCFALITYRSLLAIFLKWEPAEAGAEA